MCIQPENLESNDSPNEAEQDRIYNVIIAQAHKRRQERIAAGCPLPGEIEMEQHHQALLAKKGPTVEQRPQAGIRGGQRRTWAPKPQASEVQEHVLAKAQTTVVFRIQLPQKWALIITKGQDWNGRKVTVEVARKEYRRLVVEGFVQS